MPTREEFLRTRQGVPKIARTKKDFTKDERISVCTDCRYGIFPRHKYKWTSRGLVHEECEVPTLKESVNEVKHVT